MKKAILFVVISLTISIAAYSQKNLTKNILTGKITDEKTGMPLGGASIYIADLKIGARANEDGRYSTSSLPAGKYLVEISFVGFESIFETIDLAGTVEKNFALKATVLEQEEVTVTGVSSATRIKLSPQPVSVMKRAELVGTSSTNIINSLVHIPGVNAVTTGPAISKPFIRGLGYNRVVTVNDGIRQEGQQWGDEHGIEIDDYSAQRIEVLKGPASLTYGSDALAGVVNIQSLVPAPADLIQLNLLGDYQTNNSLRGFYGSIAGTKNGFSFNAYGSFKGAHDYKNKYDGYVFNSKFYNDNFGGMIGYGSSWGYSHLLVTNFDQRLGITEGDRDSATGHFIRPLPGGNDAIATDDDFEKTKPLIPFQHIRHFKITSDNSFNIGKERLDLTVGFQHNQRQEFGNPDDPGTADAWFNLKTVNYSAKLNLYTSGNWKTSIGLSGMYQTNENKAEEVLIPAYNLFDIGGFALTQYHKDKITFSGGLRVDNRHINSKELIEGTDVKFEAFTKNFSDISGSAGLSYEATKALTLKLNIARGFRAPNLAELASNGAHEGTIRYEIGDHNLKAENSLQIDGGLEVSSEHVSFSAMGFYNHISNFIFYRKLLSSSGGDSILINPDTGEQLTVFRFNQQTANLYGTELSLDVHPHPLDWLHFENTFSYTRARFTGEIDGTKNVPFIPAARFITGLKGNFLSRGTSVRNLYFGIESDYTFKQNDPFTGYNTETATSDYWLVDITAGTDIVNRNKTIFSIHLSAMNIGDVAYQNHLSRLKYAAINNATSRMGVFNMGRNFGIKVNVPLDFKWN
jgi:iron complex outermembrane receptor protein